VGDSQTTMNSTWKSSLGSPTFECVFGFPPRMTYSDPARPIESHAELLRGSRRFRRRLFRRAVYKARRQRRKAESGRFVKGDMVWRYGRRRIPGQPMKKLFKYTENWEVLRSLDDCEYECKRGLWSLLEFKL